MISISFRFRDLYWTFNIDSVQKGAKAVLCSKAKKEKKEYNKPETCNMLLCEKNWVYVIGQAYQYDKVKFSINMYPLSKIL